MPAPSRTSVMAQRAMQLRQYLLENPGCQTRQVMTALHIRSEASLYRLLQGLAQESELCQNGEFNLYHKGKKLTLKDLEKGLQEKEAASSPAMAERLIYLYDALNNYSPYGGIAFSDLMRGYADLHTQSGGPVPRKESLRRQVLRDLEKMESYGIVIERPSTGSKKYRLAQEYLPKLSPESASAVYVSMLLYRNTLLSEATAAAREEMEKSLFAGVPARPRDLRERIYVLGDTLENPRRFGNILGKLIRSTLELNPVRLWYINNEGEESVRTLDPLGLVCKRGVWYLMGRNAEGETRTFRVDQIQSLTIQETEHFQHPKDFSIRQHIGDSWGVFCNDPVQTVRLKFSPQVAHRVKNLRYHPSQQEAEDGPDGSVTLQFAVCGLLELQSWILPWGTQVEVLEPPELRERVRQAALEIAGRYSS